MDTQTIFLRFLITLVLSFFYGIERQKAHKPVGFGTFIFVAIGSCGLAITALTLSTDSPLPLLSAIVTGIGFLGAGALIKTTDKIFGFTTAASIWVFAIFGMVIGAGEYLIGGIIYASIWEVVLVDHSLEERGIGSYQRKIIITTNKIVNEKEIKSVLLTGTTHCKVIGIEIDKKDKKLRLTYLIEGRKEDINQIPSKLYEKEWLDECKVE